MPFTSVQIKLVGRRAKQLAPELAQQTEGMVTRAVPVQAALVPGAQASSTVQAGLAVQQGQQVQWNQRFVVALPPQLAEQLLTPAPGDNPWEVAPLELQLEVWDGSGERGLGRKLSSSTLTVTYNWLLGQVQALLAIRQAAAAATTSSTAAAAGGQHRRSLSVPGAAAAAAAEKLGQTHVLDFEAADSAGRAPDKQSSDSSDALMQLSVAVSLDDSQVSSSWYPHQRMRRQLARLVSISRDSPIKVGAGSSKQELTRQQLAPRGRLAAAAAAGGSRHALRLEGSDMWSPFSYTSLRRLSGQMAGPHTGIVPIRAGQGLVLEVSYAGGVRSALHHCGWLLLTAAVLYRSMQAQSDKCALGNRGCTCTWVLLWWLT
jgi:hypothetical protein